MGELAVQISAFQATREPTMKLEDLLDAPFPFKQSYQSVYSTDKRCQEIHERSFLSNLLAFIQCPDDGKPTARVCIGNGLGKDIWVEFQRRFKILLIVKQLHYAATVTNAGLVKFFSNMGLCGRASPLLVSSGKSRVLRHKLKGGIGWRHLRNSVGTLCKSNEVGDR